MIILRLILYTAVLVVMGPLIWYTASNTIYPVFGETTLRDIHIVGFSRQLRGWRSLTECYTMLPQTLFVSIVSCDDFLQNIEPKPVIPGTESGPTIVVELDASGLMQAEQITASINRDEPRELCPSSPITLIGPGCFTVKPSSYPLDLGLKYRFLSIDARAVGSPKNPPKLGAWKLESGLIGGFLCLGFLFATVGTMVLISNRFGSAKAPMEVPEAEETRGIEELKNAGSEEPAPFKSEGRYSEDSSNIDHYEETSKRSKSREQSPQSQAMESESSQDVDTSALEANAPTPPPEPSELDRLVARMWVEGLEADSDRLRDASQSFPRGSLDRRRMVALKIDSIISTSLESPNATPEAKAIPIAMIRSAWEEVRAQAIGTNHDDSSKPPPLDEICRRFRAVEFPHTAEMLNTLRENRLDGWYLKLAKVAEDLPHWRRSKAAAETILRECHERILGEAAILPRERPNDSWQWMRLLSAVMAEVEPYAK